MPDRTKSDEKKSDEEISHAVALRYDPKRGDAAPVVLASGRGEIARTIAREADAHGVPTRRDPALARALSEVELGASIPPELYGAVAVVLAFIYKLPKRK